MAILLQDDASAPNLQARATAFWKIEELVACAFGVPVHMLHAASRGNASAALARQCAMYLAHVVCGASYTQIGAAFGRDRTTVAYACRRVEELRERPDMDGLLTRLEAAHMQPAPAPATREMRA